MEPVGNPTSLEALARAECDQHFLLYADKQLLRSGRFEELLRRFRRRAGVSAVVLGIVGAWEFAAAAVLFAAPPVAGPHDVLPPSASAWLHVVAGVVLAVLGLHSFGSFRRCSNAVSEPAGHAEPRSVSRSGGHP